MTSSSQVSTQEPGLSHSLTFTRLFSYTPEIFLVFGLATVHNNLEIAKAKATGIPLRAPLDAVLLIMTDLKEGKGGGERGKGESFGYGP